MHAESASGHTNANTSSQSPACAFVVAQKALTPTLGGFRDGHEHPLG